MGFFLGLMLVITAMFLVMLILIQRGRGGGLAGAFGGMGGQSAFGAKAGDLFTRITIGAATFWILLCIVSVKYFAAPTSKFDAGGGTAATSTKGEEVKAPAGEKGETKDAGKTDKANPDKAGAAEKASAEKSATPAAKPDAGTSGAKPDAGAKTTGDAKPAADPAKK